MLSSVGVRFETGGPPAPETIAAAFPAVPGIYVHVPFCRSICPFCPYNKVRFHPEAATAYLDALRREARMYLDVMPGPFPSLYVGGGTPTLCLDGLAPLLDMLPVSGERAIEVLPTHMDDAAARRLRGMGFDYVSLGVQSFDREVLDRLRRPGSPAANRAAIESALGAFACVDVDLIFDAGFDRPEVLLGDLAECMGYGVDQVSTYPLMRFGYTPFGKAKHARRREHALLREAAALAGDAGYERRSVWTFNRLGASSYSSITRPYYLGLGAGAASFAGSLFMVNHFGLSDYGCAVDGGRLPVARTARLRPAAAAAYRFFWQAYTGRVPLDGGDPLLDHPVAGAIRRASVALGWAAHAGGAVALTPSGYDRYHDAERWVTYHLIEPLWAEMTAEHARGPSAGMGSGS